MKIPFSGYYSDAMVTYQQAKTGIYQLDAVDSLICFHHHQVVFSIVITYKQNSSFFEHDHVGNLPRAPHWHCQWFFSSKIELNLKVTGVGRKGDSCFWAFMGCKCQNPLLTDPFMEGLLILEDIMLYVLGDT